MFDASMQEVTSSEDETNLSPVAEVVKSRTFVSSDKQENEQIEVEKQP
jgi:hypothetical protein